MLIEDYLPAMSHEQVTSLVTGHHPAAQTDRLEFIRRDLQRPTRRAWINDVLSTPKLSPASGDFAATVSSVRSERDDELARRLR